MKLYYDLIVGFPTETDEAFMDTLNFVLNFPPSHVTVTTFSREAGTPAYDLEPLSKDVLHDRQKRLVMVYTAAQNILSRQDPTLVREFGT
jgi:tRNA A37 methylthiotransferase MiaB